MTKIDRDTPASKAAPAVGYSPRHLVLMAREGKVPASLRVTRWFFNIDELKTFFGMRQDSNASD